MESVNIIFLSIGQVNELLLPDFALEIKADAYSANFTS